MIEDMWWIDTDHWPGPYEASVVSTFPFDQFSLAMRQYGKSLLVDEHLKLLLEVYKPVTNALVAIENKNKGKGRVKNHGPRAATTFDRRGRRRY